jgi:hypothetical protein
MAIVPWPFVLSVDTFDWMLACPEDYTRLGVGLGLHWLKTLHQMAAATVMVLCLPSFGGAPVPGVMQDAQLVNCMLQIRHNIYGYVEVYLSPLY